MWPSQMTWAARPGPRLESDGLNQQQQQPVPGYFTSTFPSLPSVQSAHAMNTTTLNHPVPQSVFEEPWSTEAQNQPDRVQKRKRVSAKRQFSALEWNNHRSAIKSLYIDQDLSLEETMAEMAKAPYEFKPSKKQYKEKIEEWGYWKHLPIELALWMSRKAEQRSRPNPQCPKGKDTRFAYGTLSLTKNDVHKRTKRANLSAKGSNDIVAPTPDGISYETPIEIATSPAMPGSLRPDGGPARTWTPPPSPLKSRIRSLPPNYKRHTLADLEKFEREIHHFESEGDAHTAEEKYRDALAGFQTVLSPTHEHVNALAYRLANFYADRDRMNTADEVLNWMTEKHVDRWGVCHPNTLKHLLHVSSLYNGWSRSDDSLLLLNRVLDTWDEETQCPRAVGVNSKVLKSGLLGTSSLSEHQHQTSNETWYLSVISEDPSKFDYQLSLMKTKLESRDAAIEQTLLLLVDQFENHSQELSVQTLQARCLLIGLYMMQEEEEKLLTAFSLARALVHKILGSATQKTERLLKACINVGKLHLQGNSHEAAGDIFETVAAETEDAYISNHSASLEILIHIGKLYQSECDWTQARPWFERALAAALAIDERETPVAKALEEALETHHYSSASLIDDDEHMSFSFGELRRAKFVL